MAICFPSRRHSRSSGRPCVHPVSGAPGRPLCHPFQITSRTLAGNTNPHSEYLTRATTRTGYAAQVSRKRTAVVEHAPRNARKLVSQRRSQDVVMEVLCCSSQASFKAKLRPTPGLRQYSARPNDEQRAHIFIAAPPTVLSPVENCFGTRPSQAPMSRPFSSARATGTRFARFFRATPNCTVRIR